MSVRVGVALGLMAMACSIACGDDDDDGVADAAVAIDAAAPDAAAPPDAADPCSLCSPTQDCPALTCVCPANPNIPVPFNPILAQMDTVMAAPDVLGIAAFSPDGVAIDALVVGFHPTDTPLDTDIDLSAVAPGVAPFVGYGYEVDITAMTTRGTLRSTAGTLHLTDRCAAGVSGTMADIVVAEVDVSTDPPTIIAGGCSFTIAAVDFDFGASCE